MNKTEFIYVSRLFGLSESLGNDIYDTVCAHSVQAYHSMALCKALNIISKAYVDPRDTDQFRDVISLELRMNIDHEKLLNDWATSRFPDPGTLGESE